MITARSVDPMLRVMDRIDEHIAAEVTSDPAIISATISGEPYFPVLVRGPGGVVDLNVLTDTASVEAFYAARVTTFEIIDTNRVAEVRTDWYALHESLATVRHVGDFNGLPPTGEEYRVNSVVLFPTDHDGIVGELEWTRYDFVDVFRRAVRAPEPEAGDAGWLPVRRLAAAQAHDRLIEAWWRGDAEAVVAELAPDSRWSTRHVHPTVPTPALTAATDVAGIRAAVAEFAEAGAGAPEIRRLQRIAADWYSFGEWSLRWPAAGSVPGAELRVASLTSVDAEGRLAAHLAYSVEVAPDR